MTHPLPKAPLGDAPPLPASPFGQAPAAPLPPVTAGKSGLPPFVSRMKMKRRTAPLAPIASRAAARGEQRKERVQEAKAVQAATQKPAAKVTPIRPDVKPEPTPKPPSKAQEMRDALAKTMGKHVASRMQGTPADAHDLLRQYGAIHGRHFVGEYHTAGMSRAREMVEAARSAHTRGGPANPGVKRAAAQAADVPAGTLDRDAMRQHADMIRRTEAERQAGGQKFIRTDLDNPGEKS